YYHHILQDWAWGDAAITQRLEPILHLYQPERIDSLLALGAGAGRLSWELHKSWDAQLTLATDINPLLLAASHKLIVEQKAFAFYELNSFPQIEKVRSACYTLCPPQDPHNKRAHWHAIAADVWHMPIKANSLDVIVTAWFIDVHGGDNRTLISLIQRWLKAGGVWINSGPLLYPKNSPLECKYDREELVELMHLAGLEFVEQTLSEHGHLMSPINVRKQTEQVWTFLARKPCADETKAEHLNTANLPPPWLIFHDLPVPSEFKRPTQSHPLIDAILAHVDGKQSIDSICAATAQMFPEGLEPRSTLVEILGELFNLTSR
ncbi:MAG: methyltransferase domain-containing protein, partial [Moraxellaceae bacterium]